MSAEDDFTDKLATERTMQAKKFVDDIVILCAMPPHLDRIDITIAMRFDDGMMIIAEGRGGSPARKDLT
jgi:hypothetical protein